MKGRQLENATALGPSPAAGASRTDLVTAAFALWQAAVCLGPRHVLLGQGDKRRNVLKASYLSFASRGTLPRRVFIQDAEVLLIMYFFTFVLIFRKIPLKKSTQILTGLLRLFSGALQPWPSFNPTARDVKPDYADEKKQEPRLCSQ